MVSAYPGSGSGQAFGYLCLFQTVLENLCMPISTLFWYSINIGSRIIFDSFQYILDLLFSYWKDDFGTHWYRSEVSFLMLGKQCLQYLLEQFRAHHRSGPFITFILRVFQGLESTSTQSRLKQSFLLFIIVHGNILHEYLYSKARFPHTGSSVFRRP